MESAWVQLGLSKARGSRRTPHARGAPPHHAPLHPAPPPAAHLEGWCRLASTTRPAAATPFRLRIRLSAVYESSPLVGSSCALKRRGVGARLC